MMHDTAMPRALHDGGVASVKDALGAFWSSVFRDQDFVDALLLARVLSAGQVHVDAMEALSLRDHQGSPVFHREHWHPVLVRLSKRNSASAIVVGMPDTPVLGPQDDSGAVYLPGEVFTIGGNALYSKVNTYPVESVGGCPLVRVATALCDSVASPRHILSEGRDFTLVDGVLVIRKEQDPFDSDGYRVEEDGDDRIAVLWACDAELDRDYVADFVGYPLGIYAQSTGAASRMLSALWDAVTLGLTPISFARVLGAAFGVPVVSGDTTVEAVTEDGDESLVVVHDRVYRIETARLPERIKAGAGLKAGDFLTDEIAVHWGLSADDVAELVADGRLSRVALPPGSVAGVDETVVLEPGERAMEEGGWFKLNEGDSAESPFWQAVFARTTGAEREALFQALSHEVEPDVRRVNPLMAIGPVVLANLILVETSRHPVADSCTGQVLDFLRRLVPSYASLLVVQEAAPAEGEVGMSDDVECALFDETVSGSTMAAGSDDVAFTFVPVAATEV